MLSRSSARCLVASLFAALISGGFAYACDVGYKDYFGRCVETKPAPAKLVAFLKGYGQQTDKVGEVADLFAPDVPLFDKPEPGARPFIPGNGPVPT